MSVIKNMENKEMEKKVAEATKALMEMINALLYIGIMSLVLMFFWNWSIPAIFGLIKINYIQALSLYAITQIVYKAKKITNLNFFGEEDKNESESK